MVVSSCAFAQQETKLSTIWLTIEKEEAVPFWEGGTLKSQDEYMNRLIEEYSIEKSNKAFPDSRKSELEDVYELSCQCNPDALVEELAKSSHFSTVEVAPEYELLSTPGPNDYSTQFPVDYALDLINAQTAWEYSTGDTSLVIGISDGAFYSNQEDLQSEYVSLNNGINAPANYYYHGTAVAITAAGATNNFVGKSSIGYDCRLALNTMGYNQLLALSYGGARVVNASWSAGCMYSVYGQYVIDELNENGTIVVAAAGNGNTCGGASNLVYPSAYDKVISVTSIGPLDNHEKIIGDTTSTHQHNSTVDICAPGYNVPLGIAPNFYTTASGTSFAAPFVAGTIGLILSIRPCLDYDAIMEIFEETSVNIDNLNPAYAAGLGMGRLNAGKALEYASLYHCDPGSDYLSVISPAEGEYLKLGSNNSKDYDDSPFELTVYPSSTKGPVHVKWNESGYLTIRVDDLSGRSVET